MAKYTITIKTLLDNNFDFQLNSYPIFDENYRNTLNNNILFHYYENEIGLETPALFRFYLKQRLNEIMPFYNTLYNVQKKLIDENLLLNNVNLTETFDGENTKNDTMSGSSTGNSESNNESETTETGTTSNTNETSISEEGTNDTTTSGTSQSTSTNTGSATNKKLYQDTPQGTISTTDIENQTWATNLTLDSSNTSNTITDNSTTSGTSSNTTSNTTESESSENGTSSNTINSTSSDDSSSTSSFENENTSEGTNNYIKTIIGNNGNKFNIDILNDIKNNLINIDLMIINDLSELFMQIY